jgi:hypothetical protein
MQKNLDIIINLALLVERPPLSTHTCQVSNVHVRLLGVQLSTGEGIRVHAACVQCLLMEAMPFSILRISYSTHLLHFPSLPGTFHCS